MDMLDRWLDGWMAGGSVQRPKDVHLSKRLSPESTSSWLGIDWGSSSNSYWLLMTWHAWSAQESWDPSSYMSYMSFYTFDLGPKQEISLFFWCYFIMVCLSGIGWYPFKNALPVVSLMSISRFRTRFGSPSPGLPVPSEERTWVWWIGKCLASASWTWSNSPDLDSFKRSQMQYDPIEFMNCSRKSFSVCFGQGRFPNWLRKAGWTPAGCPDESFPCQWHSSSCHRLWVQASDVRGHVGWPRDTSRI